MFHMKVASIGVAFVVLISSVQSLLHGGSGILALNAVQPRNCAPKLRIQKVNSRPTTRTELYISEMSSFAPATPPVLSKFSLLAYDNAYTVNKETLRGMFKDHKFFKHLYYDYEADEVYWVTGVLLLSFVALRVLWAGESILKSLGLIKEGSRDVDTIIDDTVRAWHKFTGKMKTDDEKKRQLQNTFSEADVVSTRPLTKTFECEKCHMQLMPAKGRASFILGKPTFRCARCGSKAAAYFDINDMDDERAVARKKRLENEALGLDEDGNELDFNKEEDDA